ncbi:hypothetical protein SDC9_180187 [bioreactor metagenome]|uniref:Uncharacterized protein n=1 Tax=bioreactor metagenome TaxID=1076179 RepID=A0A645H109_9ZZZZ
MIFSIALLISNSDVGLTKIAALWATSAKEEVLLVITGTPTFKDLTIGKPKPS